MKAKTENIKKTIALAMSLLSVGLYGCGSVTESVADSDSSATSTTAAVVENIEDESKIDGKTVERNTVVSVNYPGDGHNIAEENWNVEDESVKQKVFDWYEDFKAGNFKQVKKSVAREHLLAGRTPMSVCFYDENNQLVKVSGSDSSLADFCFDGEYYKFNDKSDNLFQTVYETRPSEVEQESE